MSRPTPEMLRTIVESEVNISKFDAGAEEVQDEHIRQNLHSMMFS